MLIIREIKWNAINLKRRNRLASRDINFYKAFIQGLNHQGSRIKLYTVKKGTEKRLFTVILKLGMFSEVVCNWFTKDAYLPRVVCTVFGFAH